MIKKKYLILTGGTGGHVIPAVNFGNFIISKGHNCCLIVDERGKKYIDSFNGQIVIISSSHLSHNMFGKIKAIFLLIKGFFQSFKHLLGYKADLCISFGSYATFMPLLACFILRFNVFTKIYLHEQNSVMGKVNSLFSNIAEKIFLNFDITQKLKIKNMHKFHIVGLPSNNKVKFKKRNSDNFENNKTIKIFISGGSQGSKNLNKIVLNLFSKIPEKILNNIFLFIQCPENQKKEIEYILNKIKIKYKIKFFYDDFVKILQEVNVLISRSGAGTINDVIYTQIPAIFVPLPSSMNNHQFQNANYLKNNNAAYLIDQKDLNSNKSLSVIIDLITNLETQNKLIKKLQEMKNFDTNTLMFKYINEKK